jgi:hypothetical protein
MHKMEFGQAYYQDLVKRILNTFIWYYSKLYYVFYAFYKFIHISVIFKLEEKFKKRGPVLGSLPAQGRGLAARCPYFACGPKPEDACHVSPARWAKSPHARRGGACTRCGHCDHGQCGGAVTGGEPDL